MESGESLGGSTICVWKGKESFWPWPSSNKTMVMVFSFISLSSDYYLLQCSIGTNNKFVFQCFLLGASSQSHFVWKVIAARLKSIAFRFQFYSIKQPLLNVYSTPGSVLRAETSIQKSKRHFWILEISCKF